MRTKKWNVLPGTFILVAGTEDGVTDGATISTDELDVCTCSNAKGFAFPSAGDGTEDPVFGADATAFDPDATALGAWAGTTAGPDSEARVDEATETGGADAGAGDGDGDMDGEGDGEGVDADAPA